MKNPKTTWTGLSLIIGGLVTTVYGVKTVNATMVQTGITAIVSGIGLILAKDATTRN